MSTVNIFHASSGASETPLKMSPGPCVLPNAEQGKKGPGVDR